MRVSAGNELIGRLGNSHIVLSVVEGNVNVKPRSEHNIEQTRLISKMSCQISGTDSLERRGVEKWTVWYLPIILHSTLVKITPDVTSIPRTTTTI